MFYVENACKDPHFNLALEQYVFDELAQKEDVLMLWQNANAIIVGKHQNTLEEINAAYVREHGIQVVRRLSGGGAVYHDLGNVNYTFIAEHTGSGFDFSTFCQPVGKALESMGVTAALSGRNDMTIGGQKFSGNAQYVKHGRVMHHGTILFDSNLDMVSRALKVPEDKFSSKGFKSVHSRMTNVKPHLSSPISTPEFMARLHAFFFEEYALTPYVLSEQELRAVDTLKREVYDKWDWNFGASPACQIQKKRRVKGCGQIEIHMDVENGKIQALAFYGDYFGNGDCGQLAALLVGAKLEEEDICARLADIDASDYFNHLDSDTLCAILLA